MSEEAKTGKALAPLWGVLASSLIIAASCPALVMGVSGSALHGWSVRHGGHASATWLRKSRQGGWARKKAKGRMMRATALPA